MEWVRDWILQIAGIIVMGALCDMIMPGGEMKKYVKMVVGLVLVFAVLRPISSITLENIEIEVPKDAHSRAVELQGKLEDTERKEVMRLYCRNLENKITDEIEKIAKAYVNVKVVEEDGSDFGEIKEVSVILEEENGEKTVDTIKDTICRTFGVDKDCIRVETG